MAQKDFNTNLAGKRVGIENGLVHVNVLRIVKAKNRNYRFGFRENLIKTVCGLYNFRKPNSDVVQKQEIMYQRRLLMSMGAWDYPANTRGYTWGMAAEYV